MSRRSFRQSPTLFLSKDVSVEKNPSPEDVKHILDNLREQDLKELRVWGAGPELAASTFEAGKTCATLVRFRGVPTFVFGLIFRSPDEAVLWGFGTSDTWRTLPRLSDWGPAMWLPHKFKGTWLRNIRVYVPRTSPSYGWLRGFGMKELAAEGTLKVATLVYTRKDYLNVLRYGSPSSSHASRALEVVD